MAKTANFAANPEEQLAQFLAKYTPEIGAQAETILGAMRRLYPTAAELVYDNYNALAIGFAPSEKTSEAIFSIAVYPKWVSLFFLQAAGLPDPDRILKGSGNVAKHVVLQSPAMLHDPAVAALMQEAAARARVPFPAKGEHKLVIKSVSAKQRPRRPETKSTTNPETAPTTKPATKATTKPVAKPAAKKSAASGRR
jgi:hypothetical protein